MNCNRDACTLQYIIPAIQGTVIQPRWIYLIFLLEFCSVLGRLAEDDPSRCLGQVPTHVFALPYLCSRHEAFLSTVVPDMRWLSGRSLCKRGWGGAAHITSILMCTVALSN